MTSEELFDLVRSHRTTPTSAVADVDQILDDLQKLEKLEVFVQAAIAEQCPWATSLSAFAVSAALRPPRPDDVETLAGLTFDLAGAVVDLGCGGDSGSGLTAMKWLVEYGALIPRNGADRMKVLEQLWWCARHGHASERSECIDLLERIEDFGDLVAMLGLDGVGEFQRRVRTSLLIAADEYGEAELASDLATIGRLLAHDEIS